VSILLRAVERCEGEASISLRACVPCGEPAGEWAEGVDAVNDETGRGETERGKTSSSQLLTKGLRVLTHVAQQGGEVGVRELARDMEMSTTVMHRLITSLVDQRFLERNAENGKYRIGAQAFEVGKAFIRSAKIETCAPPVLRKIVEQSDLNAFLGVMRGSSVIYLIAMQDNGPLAIRVAPGAEAPLHATAMGKILLAELPDEEIHQKLSFYFDKKFSASTTKDPSMLIEEISVVRQRGYAISDDEAFRGVVSVGAPIRDFSQKVVAAMSISKPKALLREREMDHIIATALDASERISRCLGGR